VPRNAEVGITNATHSPLTRLGLVFRDHGLRARNLALFDCKHALLPQTLEFGVIATGAGLAASAATVVTLRDLLPALKADLVE